MSIQDFIRQAALQDKAIQDQELAAAVDWLDDQISDQQGASKFLYRYHVLNERNTEALRELSDDDIQTICNLTLLGLHEVMHAYLERGESSS